MVKQQILACLQLIESMHRVIRAGKWQKLSVLETEYIRTFEQLKTEIATGTADADVVQSMICLEQQQRRLQRLLSMRLKETAEKLSVIEDAGKRLQNSSKLASSLAAG